MSAESIWFRYHDLLLLRAERLLQDPRVQLRCSPEDLVMETITRAIEAGEHLRGLSEPQQRAYVLRIQENLATDQFRRHVGADRRSVDREQREQDFRAALNDSTVGLSDVLPGGGTSPSQGAIRNEEREQLDAAIAALPDREREAIALHRRGRPLAEIAAALGTTPDAAGGLIFRAIKRLRGLLGPDPTGST
jgi:RNA polymerase sigma-70 factor (ECF subfamily)